MMFVAIRDFVSRHRNKLVVAGVTVASVALVSKLVERKIIDWQDQQTKKIVEQQKRKEHYERTLDTTHGVLHRLLPTLRKVIEENLDCDLFVQKIRDEPQNKKQLWQQLRDIGFGRAICTIICTSLIAATSHVVMMIFAANTIDNDVSEDRDLDESKRKSMAPEVQSRYLIILQNLIESFVPSLISKIMKHVGNTVSSLPLNRELSLAQLESILQEITISVTTDRERFELDGPESAEYVVLPWSRYLQEPDQIVTMPETNTQLRRLYLMTVDVLNTDDFIEVVNTLVQVGLNFVLDEMATHYYNIHFDAVNKVPQVKTNSEIVEIKDENALTLEGTSANADNLKKDQECFSEVDKIESNVGSASSSSVRGESCSANPTKSISVSDPLVSSTLKSTVVKLTPSLSRVLESAIPKGDQHSVSTNNSLYQRLIICSQLEALAYNVYDSIVFS
uniref:Peroxisomal biogenesis factor 3 n=1 Tax=Hirondellea gigas TaxID=1518452 RepID=A0A6A7FR51_9CRUS